MGGFQLHTAEWMNLTNVLVSKGSQTRRRIYYVYYKIPGKTTLVLLQVSPQVGESLGEGGEPERRDQNELLGG